MMNKEGESQMEFIGKIGQLEIQEDFVESIKLFSQYLTYTNEDYMYNETYLQLLCYEFLEFKKYVELKNQIVVRIYRDFLNGINDWQPEILVDQCWHYNAVNLGVAKKINRSKVCRNKIEIKGKLEIDRKEYIFIKEYTIIENGELIEKEISQIIQELKKWVEEKRNV